MLVGVKLLDRTRKISRLLHNNSSFVVVFNDICKCVGDILSANVLVVSAKGKVLGVYEKDDIPSLQEMLTDNVGEHIDADLNERFLSVLSTKENSNLTTLGFEKASDSDYTAVILPIDFAGGRLGTTFICRLKKVFSVDDIGFRYKGIPEEYIVFGEIAGDDEKLCFHEKTGELVTIKDGVVYKYPAEYKNERIEKCH